MPKCPKCGAEVDQPIKTWLLAPKGRKGVIIGLFRCPNGHYFRAKVGEAPPKQEETA
ncbi:chorismate-binding protein [Ignicoccus pacificus DSM 13166]|uniref:Chromatin protein Cren7 n=1 Tax=Ignicoccus pacificus DSM 13166 TaxID=940294 RepID=A0A977K9J6_9CREN|nr:chorismate-binding protein [Ignicoccus pacificus DSM 13166]